ncbi:MAG: CpsD/CapB family tyrosine-protein kinase [Clostridia bacterium]|jgi:capsular exopolysaccharide synthesis family protein|nr:CpsD/CapB family tyrosine-protein kinase [Clostridia bacterium]
MNSNTNFSEYLKLCAKRLSVLWLLIAFVFPVSLIAAKIMTPVQYTITAKLSVQSDVMGETIADQYNISELSRSAALTSISLIDNSDTVLVALKASKIKSDRPMDYQKRITVKQTNDSNVLEIVVVFDSDSVLGETFMANLLNASDQRIRDKFQSSNPSFRGVIDDPGRVSHINSPWLISFGFAFAASGITAAAFFIFNIFSFAADRTLRSSQKFETLTRIPVIAAIPPVARMIGTERSVNQVSNAYRVLRSAIKYSRKGVRTIAVCSPSPRDGRTSVAIGLAQALADTNAMVLLLEADMHRPNISRELRFDPVFGLGDLLLGKANLAATINKTSNRNLYVITAVNNVNMNSIDVCDLLDSDVFTELLKAVESQFDYVIIDTPAIELLPDAAAVAGKVDGCLIVAQYGHTRTDMMKFAIDVFDSLDSEVIGIVTTNSPRRSGAFGSVSRYYRTRNSHTGDSIITTLLDNFFGVVNMIRSKLPGKRKN